MSGCGGGLPSKLVQIVFALKILCAPLMARWSMQMLTAHCVRDAPRRCLRCRIGDNPDELVALAFARRAGFCHVANGVQCGTFFAWKGTLVALSRCRTARNGVLMCLARASGIKHLGF